LEARLRDLAPHIAFPPTPAVAQSIGAAIARQPGRYRAERQAQRRHLAFAMVSVALVLMALVAIPAARHAVARWIDIPGIHLLWLDDNPPTDVETEVRLGLGDRIALDNARGQAGFDVSLPADERADTPDEIFYTPSPVPGVVSFVYLANHDLPAVPGTGVGLLITEFQGTAETVWANKSLMGGQEFRVVRVDGAEAIWLPDTHLISIQPASAGDLQTPATRSTGSVLIWNHDGVTYRIEGNLSYDTMIAIAESMEPIGP
jgi:hypothetical protein